MLIDTAGMRRKARIEENLEKFMVDDALRAIRFAHVCILMIDAREKLNRQDLAIATCRRRRPGDGDRRQYVGCG